MEVKGVQAVVTFEGDVVTITKKQLGQQAVSRRITVRDISAVTMKPGTRLKHGYVQFLVAGSEAAPQVRGMAAGRPPQPDMNSLSIPRKSNASAARLVAAVEEARRRLSQ